MENTEAQIAAELAKKLPNEGPQLNGYPEDPKPEPEKTPIQPVGVPFADYVMTNEVLDYFNMGQGAKNNAEVGQQLQTIIEWAKHNAESPDLAGILRTLRHVETGLGNTLKNDRFARLYRFVKIQQQKSVLAEKERALYL